MRLQSRFPRRPSSKRSRAKRLSTPLLPPNGLDVNRGPTTENEWQHCGWRPSHTNARFWPRPPAEYDRFAIVPMSADRRIADLRGQYIQSQAHRGPGGAYLSTALSRRRRSIPACPGSAKRQQHSPVAEMLALGTLARCASDPKSPEADKGIVYGFNGGQILWEGISKRVVLASPATPDPSA